MNKILPLIVLLIPTLGVSEESAKEPMSIGTFLIHHVANSWEWPILPSIHIHLESLKFELFGIQMGLSLHVIMTIIAGLLCASFMILAAKRNNLLPTSKFGHAIEAIVIFLREDLVIPAMGQKHAARWLPFILTLFFFLLFTNLLGLVPGMATASSNINFTAGLAIMSFVVFNLAGIVENGPFSYVKNLVPKGVPAPVLIILFPIEIMSLFTRAFALAVRLFANMTAGHIVILSLLGLITVLKIWVVAPAFFGGALFIYGLEIFVAFLQAYVFVMLTTLFIGGAIHQEH